MAEKLMAGEFGPVSFHFLAINIPAFPSSSRHLSASRLMNSLENHDRKIDDREMPVQRFFTFPVINIPSSLGPGCKLSGRKLDIARDGGQHRIAL
jgi:hypothetical protein